VNRTVSATRLDLPDSGNPPGDAGRSILLACNTDFNRIHGEQLIALPGVRQTRTFFVMKEVVDNAPLE
jgi:hypothetical protein